MAPLTRVLFWGVVAATLSQPAVPATKSNPKSNNKPSAAAVLETVLHAEQRGRIGDRVKRLKSARNRQPDFAPLRWQSGEVRQGKSWSRFEGIVKQTGDSKLIQQYFKLRSRTKLTLRGHWKLADWCRRHGMPDRARAHLTAVLEFAPNHLAARKALGYVRFGSLWIRKADLAKRQKDAAIARKNLQHWLPKILAIRTALLGSNNRALLKARKQLESIKSADAADAIELGLGWHSPHLAAVAVDRLGGIEHPYATVSLARLAVASPWKSTRSAAAKHLTKRKFDHFVPQLLAATRTPVQSRRLLYMRPNGSLHYRHAFYREDRNTRRISVADYNHYVVRLHRQIRFWDGVFLPGDPNRPADFRQSQDNLFSAIGARSRITNDAERTASELSGRRRVAVTEENRRTREINTRVRDLIAGLSNEKFGNDPRELWDWWESYSEVWRTGPKPVDYQYRRTDTFQYLETVDINLSTLTPPGRSNSCLVAGTPVWTERGLVAVDKVRIGDRVLSKDVTTGELAYKPVLKTTVRPAVPLMKLEIGNRTISLTKGHPFWISGRGWTKAKDIQQGMYLHDVTGTTTVVPAGAAKPAKTYNLVVADFHTYFVGEAKVLSHDNTPIEPTSALVPGLIKK